MHYPSFSLKENTDLPSHSCHFLFTWLFVSSGHEQRVAPFTNFNPSMDK